LTAGGGWEDSWGAIRQDRFRQGNLPSGRWRLNGHSPKPEKPVRKIMKGRKKNMKKMLFVIVTIFIAVSAQAADVGVSVTIGQPGFYGHIDVGNFPKPELVFPRPVVIAPVPVSVAPPPPVYMHVPPGHEKNWKKYCHKYKACDRPVYFVRNQWYDNVYVPEYKARHARKGGKHGDDRGQRGGKAKGPGKGKRN
jgi:hypothetical protein